MPASPEERYLEWLDREEEKLGADFMERATFDIDTFRQMLADELTPEALAGNIQAIIDTADTKYRDLGEVGLSFERIKQAWGYQPAYRDLETGQFISREEMNRRLGR
jgi:hypothetical protein